MSARIMLRYLSGSKANQIEQFPAGDGLVIRFGRDPDNTVTFDPQWDDLVSRRHASLSVIGEDRPRFVLADLGSRNGTLVNGVRLNEPRALMPDDAIEFGPGGPKFTFDVQPRPPHMMAQTRAMEFPSKSGRETRMVAVQGEVMDPPPAPPPPHGVGRETVARMLGEERRATSRNWMYAAAALLLVVGLGGAALYLREIRADRNQAAQLAAAQEQMRKGISDASAAERARIGLSPEDIVQKYGNSTVVVSMEWHAIDQDTGKPIYQKMLPSGSGAVPCYVKLADGVIVRWLVNEDQNHINRLVGGAGSGSGFVISANGFIVTNKHVAAGWRVPYAAFSDEDSASQGALFEMRGHHLAASIEPIGHLDGGLKAMMWTPDEGGIVFRSDIPQALAAGKKLITGTDVKLDVRFPGNPSPIEAKLVNVSEAADAATIKIDTGQDLTPVVMAPDNDVREGERVTVLGFPAFSSEIHALRTSLENGMVHEYNDVVPQPTVTEGVISLLSPSQKQMGGVTLAGDMGDVYQLTVPSSHGNSGGPVFDAKGNVIAIFTYGSATRETTTYAVPISYARDLLQLQRRD